MDHMKQHTTPHTSIFTRGFTLIEMIVAVALFSMVITITMPTLIVVMNSAGRAQAVQATVDNVSFAIDAMSSAIRLGSSYYCTSTSYPVSLTLPTGTQDCPSGATTFVFTSALGVRTAYQFNASAGTLDVRTEGVDWVALTSTRVRISDARFIASGSSGFDGAQPEVRFIVRGASRDDTTVPEFYLQTSMEQYVGDQGLIFRKIANGTNGGPTLTNSDKFGTAIATIGDINSDSVADIAVGANGDDTGGTNRGAVYVFRMNTNGTVAASTKIASGVNGGPTLADGDSFGGAVSSVGDLNSDGVSDVVVGAGGNSIYVLLMKSDGTASTTVKIASGVNGGPTLNAGDGFGASITTVGDLNNDGTSDLIVGAPLDDTGGTDRGAVYVLYMRADGAVASSAKIASGVGGGPTLANGDDFGLSVASVGDLNNNGVPDIVVGAPLDNTGGTDRGALYVLYMNANGTVASSVKITSSGNGGPALADSSAFGRSLAGVGDLNRDGIPDLITGFDVNDAGLTSSTGVYLLFMNTNGTVISSVKVAHQTNGGPTLVDGDHFGFSVGSVGDINRDGILDLGAGSYGDDTGGTDRGAVYIMFGK